MVYKFTIATNILEMLIEDIFIKLDHPKTKGAKHTQLGTKKGRRGKYKQAREFNEKNQEVKDIDFTDHGIPSNHTNLHQHTYSGNGRGQRARSKKAEPLK